MAISPAEKSRRQAEKKKAERHARGLLPRGRPRNNPHCLAHDARKSCEPVGRPRKGVDEFVENIKAQIRERDANPDDPRNQPPTPEELAAWRKYRQQGGTMQEDLDRYAKYLVELWEADQWRQRERLLALEQGITDPKIPCLPGPPISSWHAESLEETLEWYEARKAMERDFLKNKGVRTLPGITQEADDPEEDFPEEWDDKPPPEAISSAAAPPEPPLPVPKEGEKYRDYVKRVSLVIGCSYFLAVEAVKSYKLWKP